MFQNYQTITVLHIKIQGSKKHRHHIYISINQSCPSKDVLLLNFKVSKTVK